ncbi:hypothetical protein AK812_SmicGene38508 [Symbiodinium microadriaticum]|uniref:Uncharacterized protein n=1 Tax=Symbiodinium microadriaticum TaxID=2951 RepID=A0A1Q9CDL3_SYMMI|nr:hypothetical protein AK812_SmicGene38508 [Symbiodinium microadriaticum]
MSICTATYLSRLLHSALELARAKGEVAKALNAPEALHGAAPMHPSAKRSLAQTWASRLLEASSLRETVQSWLQDLRQVPSRLRQDRNSGWAAVLIASWGILFCSLLGPAFGVPSDGSFTSR